VGDDLTPAAGRDYGDTLWAPTAESAGRTEIARYAGWLENHGGPANSASDGILSYRELWQWSVDEPAAFWSSIWDFFGVLGTRGSGPVLTGQMPDVSWFAGSTLNYARNALHRAAVDPAEGVPLGVGHARHAAASPRCPLSRRGLSRGSTEVTKWVNSSSRFPLTGDRSICVA